MQRLVGKDTLWGLLLRILQEVLKFKEIVKEWIQKKIIHQTIQTWINSINVNCKCAMKMANQT